MFTVARRAAQTNCSSREFWWLEREEREKTKEQENKIIQNWKAPASRWWSTHTQLCHTAQDTCPQFAQPDPLRAPCAGPGDRATKTLPKQKGMDGFHPQASLVAVLTFLPARKAAQWPSFARLSTFPGHIFCLRQGWVAGHSLQFVFTSKITPLPISQR